MLEKNLRFDDLKQADYANTLNARVDEYFLENNLSKKGGRTIVVKTIFMLLLYYVPYALIISGEFQHPLQFFIYWIIMSLGMTGIGMVIMHDANHGAFSEKKSVNEWVGLTANLMGVSKLNWQIQHNDLHHSFTNIDGYDDNLEGGKLLRFSPHKKRYAHQKYQQYYAWFLYTLQTIVWTVFTDFKRLVNYYRMGLMSHQDKTFSRHLAELIAWKVYYFTFILVLPIVFLDSPWWWVVCGFFLMQFISGFWLSCLILPAHIMPPCAFPLPDKDGEIENNFLVHQLHTCCNFATSNRLFSWFSGGINYQVEHHLFPDICHIHYRSLSKIVQETNLEFSVPYNSYPTFYIALRGHFKMLKMLGSQDRPAFY